MARTADNKKFWWHYRTESDIRSGQREREAWMSYGGTGRRVVALRIATQQRDANKADPFIFDRVMSRLMSGAETPQDYGMSPETVAHLIGASRVLNLAA